MFHHETGISKDETCISDIKKCLKKNIQVYLGKGKKKTYQIINNYNHGELLSGSLKTSKHEHVNIHEVSYCRFIQVINVPLTPPPDTSKPIRSCNGAVMAA